MFPLPVMPVNLGVGEIAALSAAVLWTISSLLYGRTRLSAWGINFTKNIFASCLVLGHMLVAAVVTSNGSMFQASAESWAWLGLSGLIGIVVGDTFYFRSLQILGPRLALVMATTSPLFAAVMGWLLLGETLHFASSLGILIAVVGISFVVLDRKARKEAPGLFPGRRSEGIWLGIAGAICQAIGGAMSKLGMTDCDPLEATFIRLIISAVCVLILVGASRQLKAMLQSIFKLEVLRNLLPAIAIGTWLGIWCSQIAFKNTEVAIAQTLLSTSPLFAIPIVWLFLGHRPTVRAWIGTFIAFVGIYLAIGNH